MSSFKRGAVGQMTKDDGDDFSGRDTPDDPPQRATSMQMAGRKIAQAKGRRGRPGIFAASPSAPSPSALSVTTNSFSNVNTSTSNGFGASGSSGNNPFGVQNPLQQQQQQQQKPQSSTFTFGSQQPSNPTFGGVALSGPLFGNNTQSSSQNAATTAFNIPVPPTSSGFLFTSQPSNPFSNVSATKGHRPQMSAPTSVPFGLFGQTTGQNAAVRTEVSGDHGSDMQISPPATPVKTASQNVDEDARKPTVSATFSFQRTTASNPTTSGVFGMPAGPAATASPPKFSFDQPAAPADPEAIPSAAPTTTPSNVFAGLLKKAVPPSNDAGSSIPAARTANLFGAMDTRKSDSLPSTTPVKTNNQFGVMKTDPPPLADTSQASPFSTLQSKSPIPPEPTASTLITYPKLSSTTTAPRNATNAFAAFASAEKSAPARNEAPHDMPTERASTFANTSAAFLSQSHAPTLRNQDNASSLTENIDHDVALRALNTAFQTAIMNNSLNLDWSKHMRIYLSYREDQDMSRTEKGKALNIDNPKKPTTAMEHSSAIHAVAASGRSQTANLFHSIVDGPAAETLSPTRNTVSTSNPSPSIGSVFANSAGLNQANSADTSANSPNGAVPKSASTRVASAIPSFGNATTSSMPTFGSPFSHTANAASNTSSIAKTSSLYNVTPSSNTTSIFKLGAPGSNSATTPTTTLLTSNIPASAKSMISAAATSPVSLFSAQANGSNFLSQFGQAASKTADMERAKRKAEDFDSDEDDEASWEKKDAEEQRAKKAKLQEKAKVSVPTFGALASGTNFLSQFGQAATKSADAEKAQRKAQDFDSDEDDEADWEKKYAAEQEAKKAKLPGDAKTKNAKFIPGKGFIFEEAADTVSPSVPTSKSFQSATSPQPTSVASIFSQPATKTPSANMFSHLINSATTTQDGSDDEDNDDHEVVQRKTPPQTINGQSRATDQQTTSKMGGSSNDRHTTAEGATTSIATVPSAIFGQSAGLLNFGGTTGVGGGFQFGAAASPKAYEIGPNAGAVVGDHTWKVDSPIKFGAQQTAGTSGLKYINASPVGNPPPAEFSLKPVDGAKPAPFKFNAPGAGSTPSLFGSTAPSSGPTSSLFGVTTPLPGSASSLFGSTTPAGSPAKQGNIGFTFAPQSTNNSKPGFGPLFPAATSQQSPVATSQLASNASIPGSDTNEAAAGPNGGDDADENSLSQLDLTALTAEEKRDEDVLFATSAAKLMLFNKEHKEKPWDTKGTGPLRVLKNKKTGVARIVVRIAPTGRVIVNSRLLSSMEYSKPGKGLVKFVLAEAAGSLSTWMARLGADEEAVKLKDILQANK